MANQVNLFENAAAVHPGEMIAEYLEFYGWSQRDLHRRTGLTPKLISEICSGKAPITPSTALALERLFQRGFEKPNEKPGNWTAKLKNSTKINCEDLLRNCGD